MKFLRHASAILLGLGIAAAVGSSAAWSQEQLVMPFACDAHGGGVRLYPAPQQSYRIYGTREHKLFSYCSPNTPDRCHNWMLHRFDLDCSGVRVPWISVAEAAAQRGRAWVEDGRMSLQMGAVWASPREERYPRRRWWERRHQFYDEGFDERGSFERPAGSPRDVVELPPDSRRCSERARSSSACLRPKYPQGHPSEILKRLLPRRRSRPRPRSGRLHPRRNRRRLRPRQ